MSCECYYLLLVSIELGDEFVKIGKAAFVAQMLHKLDAERPSIQIALEADDVYLDAAFRAIVHRRAMPDIEHADEL